jgi:hypothetical protein
MDQIILNLSNRITINYHYIYVFTELDDKKQSEIDKIPVGIQVLIVEIRF